MSGIASFRVFALAVVFVLGMLSTGSQPVFAQNSAGMGASGLPVPRFVSLKTGKVNLRKGPGSTYPVEWLYVKPGLPIEIIEEFDNWRRVRDSDGSEGWVIQSMLVGKRTAIAAPWKRGEDGVLDLLAEPDAGARKVALIQPGAIGSIKGCNGEWCEMSFEVDGDRYKGWMTQNQIWGVYPDEKFGD